MSPYRPIGRRTDSGFTLLELMLVVSLLAIFFGSVYETVIVGLRTANAADDREDVRQQAANALDRFVREASLAKVVRQATSQVFEFDADLTGDGTAETNILYQLQNDAIVRTYGGTTTTLVRSANTPSLTFAYFKQDRATWVSGTDALSTIRVAQVTLTATKDTETLSLINAAYLRSM